MLHLSRVLTSCPGGGLRSCPVEAVWLPGARPLPVRFVTLQAAGGLLRLQTHGEDHLPAVHVLRWSFLHPTQPAGAQSPGLEEDPLGSEAPGAGFLGRI